MPKKIHGIIIDPEDSFCRVVPQQDQQRLHSGELCVPGAWQSMERLAAMICRIPDKFDDFTVTFDQHHWLHISHPGWLRHCVTHLPPEPFTIIYEDNGVIKGKTIAGQELGEYEVFNPVYRPWTVHYLQSLAAGGRYPHMIWPPHCLIGTDGAKMVPALFEALLAWEQKYHAFVNCVAKGSNYKVEHFSAVRAEVADPDDHTTQMNSKFIETVMESDIILLAGEARSHCLANTVRDIANSFADDSFIKKCVLLNDCTDDVPGCESMGEAFVQEMTKRGMQVTTSVDFLA